MVFSSVFKVSLNHKVSMRRALLDLVPKFKAMASTFTSSKTDGTLTTNVINNIGTTLPGTGGIGTTIFYVIGGGLMVAAAILLITKKRMENR